MKKLTIILLCFIAFTACKKENNPLEKIKKATKEVKKTANDINNAKNVFSNLGDGKELITKLKQLDPLGKETMKSWMPEQLKDLKRTSYKIGSASLGNINSMNLQYKGIDNIQKQFKAEIIDGAGNGSGIVYMYMMTLRMKLDSETERGYSKIHKRGKTTVKETFRKQKYNSTTKMEFLMNDRFAVTVSANNIEPDELWEYVKALEFDKLKE